MNLYVFSAEGPFWGGAIGVIAESPEEALSIASADNAIKEEFQQPFFTNQQDAKAYEDLHRSKGHIYSPSYFYLLHTFPLDKLANFKVGIAFNHIYWD